jgi:WD40 repeat protein
MSRLRSPQRGVPLEEQAVTTDTGATTEPTDDRVKVLEAFNLALKQESHVLRARPEILWQQMYNRLQWDQEPVLKVLAPALAQRSAPGAAPWLRTRTAPRESSARARTFTGNFKDVRSCGFSPDGRLIVAATAVELPGSGRLESSVRVWDVDRGLEVLALKHDNVTVCKFSPDGRYLVSGAASEHPTVKLWDVGTGAELRTLKPTGGVVACAVSPDGCFVLAGGHPDNWSKDPTTLKLWDVGTGAELVTLKERKRQHTSACAFSPDGRFIVSVHRPIGEAPMTVLWDRKGGKVLRTLPYDSPCAFSPDGRFVVSSVVARNEWGREIGIALKLWDPRSGKELRTITTEDGDPGACAVSPNGRWLVWACNDATLRLIDADSGVELGKLSGHDRNVNSCAFSPDGRFIVSASGDDTLKIWDVEEAVKAGAPTGSREGATDDALDSYDRLSDAAATSESGRGGFRQILSARSPDGRSLYRDETSPGTFFLYPRNPNEPCREFFNWLGRGPAAAFFFGPNGRLYILAHPGTEIVERVGEEDHTSFLKTDRKVLWDCESGAEPRELPDEFSGGWPEFSPDGRFIVSAVGGTLQLLDVDSGRAQPRNLQSHTSENLDFEVSPDGRFIAASNSEGIFASEIALWDVESGSELAILPVAVSVGCVAFHPTLPQLVYTPRGQVGSIVIREEQPWERQAFDLVGIEYGPIIVTAFDHDGHLEVPCPGCREALKVNRSQLGREMVCPDAGCRTRLRLNPFTLM